MRNRVTSSSVDAVVQAGVVHGGVHVQPGLAAPRRLPAVPHQLPAVPRGFVGRADELADLDRFRADAPEGAGGTVVISAIGGAGGIGKTWLALYWAHRRMSWFPDGQLFVDLRGFSPDAEPVSPAVAVRGFLDALGVDPALIPTDPPAQTALFRSIVVRRRMLIVLDNAIDSDQVVPLLPGGDSCTVLVTSRRTLTTVIARHSGRHLALDALDVTEARALLTRRLGEARTTAEPGVVDELIRLCGGFPLALGIVAARAQAQSHVPLREFVAELRGLGLAALDDDDPAASLPTVLSWSYRALTERQQKSLGMLGMAPGPDIDLHAAAALLAASVPQTRRVLRALLEASLLKLDEHGRYSMHDLIRRHAASVGEVLPSDEREAALRRIVDFYLHAAHAADRVLDPYRDPVELDTRAPDTVPNSHPDGPSALRWFETEHACLVAAQRTAAAHHWHQPVWQLAWALDTFHYRRAYRHDRLAVWQTALTADAHLEGPTHVHRGIGFAYAELGRADEAVAHLRRALAEAERHNDLTAYAHAHQLLGRAWEQHGDYRRAFEHASRSLETFRAIGNPVWEADGLNQVGWYAARLGDLDRARLYCEAALAAQRQHGNFGGQIAAMDSLGYIAHHSGHHHEAVDHYRNVLTACYALGHTYQLATTLDGVGYPHAALGQHDEARTAWRQAVELYRAQRRDQDAERLQRLLDDLD
jgi:tetratricopeptide (TPR) repeat protein